MRNFPIRQKMLNWALLTIAISLAWPLGPCLAGTEEMPLPAHYPEAFNIVMCIERVDSDRILMGDSLYKYAHRVKYYVPETPEPVSRSRFRPGRKVGLILNSRNQVESMWYIERCR